jgi:hypothetical protein
VLHWDYTTPTHPEPPPPAPAPGSVQTTRVTRVTVPVTAVGPATQVIGPVMRFSTAPPGWENVRASHFNDLIGYRWRRPVSIPSLGGMRAAMTQNQAQQVTSGIYRDSIGRATRIPWTMSDTNQLVWYDVLYPDGNRDSFPIAIRKAGDTWMYIPLADPKATIDAMNVISVQADVYKDPRAYRARGALKGLIFDFDCKSAPISAKCGGMSGAESFVGLGNYIEYGSPFDTWGNPVNLGDPEPLPIPPVTVVGQRDPVLPSIPYYTPPLLPTPTIADQGYVTLDEFNRYKKHVECVGKRQAWCGTQSVRYQAGCAALGIAAGLTNVGRPWMEPLIAGAVAVCVVAVQTAEGNCKDHADDVCTSYADTLPAAFGG